MHGDKTLTCVDCGAEFTFTSSEQEFYAEKGFTNQPKRCNECRSSRKQQRRAGDREMHKTICAECGVTTQVPFKPSNDKPVYCSDCFRNKRSRY